MAEKSLIDYAYDVLSGVKEPVAFKELFDKAVALSGLELSDDEVRSRMSKLYTQLSIDGRFIILTDNCWDLRSRHVFSQVHIDMEDAYSDDEEEYDAEEAELLAEELGEENEKDDSESDDLDFDKQKTDQDSEEDF